MGSSLKVSTHNTHHTCLQDQSPVLQRRPQDRLRYRRRRGRVPCTGGRAHRRRRRHPKLKFGRKLMMPADLASWEGWAGIEDMAKGSTADYAYKVTVCD